MLVERLSFLYLSGVQSGPQGLEIVKTEDSALDDRPRPLGAAEDGRGDHPAIVTTGRWRA
ncbi:hypothetical protein ABEG17_03830 [Pedococcus sp. KACC 23699]|uniref:Uncharacterized protein n=1 Tax=Pedococcus sp. KACC 23699 TaxID=3149228 RepID=A0AAU7JVN3_9MICO